MKRAQNIGFWLAVGLIVVLARAGSTDVKAEELIARARLALTRMQSLRAEFEFTTGQRTYRGTASLKRPNLARVEIPNFSTPNSGSDGKRTYLYLAQTQQVRESSADPDGKTISIPIATDLAGFFNPEQFIPVPPEATTTARRETVDGVEYDLIEVVYKTVQLVPLVNLRGRPIAPAGKEAEKPTPQPARRIHRYYLSADGLLARRVSSMRIGDVPPVEAEVIFRRLAPNAPLADADFQWTPPPSAKLVRVPTRADYDAALVPIGKGVPDFELPTPDGNRLALHQELKKTRVTLINFWFHGCPPCRAEFPHLQKLYEENRERGFQIIAVNRGDPAEKVRDYFAAEKLTFRTVLGGQGENYTVGRAYGVRAYPTNYLVDATGKVLWSGVGFNEEALREALEKALQP